MNPYVISTLLVCFFNITLSYAQGIGINTCEPDTSSVLEIHSTNKGVLLPRMTSAQRDSIQNPAEGLVLYNTDAGTFNVYNGDKWKKLISTNTQLPTNVTINVALTTWSAMPSATTEFLGLSIHRFKVDIVNADSIRIVANVSTSGIGTSELKVQYSKDNGSTWSYVDGVSGPATSLSLAGLNTSTWTPIEDDAKGDYTFRLVGEGGNGFASPVVGLITVQYK